MVCVSSRCRCFVTVLMRTTIPARHPGAGRDPFAVLVRRPCLFPPASRAGVPPFFAWPKKGGPKKGHPGAALFVRPWTKSLFDSAGLADAPSLARRQVGAIHCAHPLGLIVRASPQHRGPIGALPARVAVRSEWCGCAWTRPWMAVTGASNAPLHDAAARSRAAEQAPNVQGQGWPTTSAGLPM